MKSTPWGPSQYQKQKAKGIIFYSTASHGGYHLSPSRQSVVEKRLPMFSTFTGGPWYEEDSDVAVVVLAFPELFSASEVRWAVQSARSSAKPFNFGTKEAPSVQRYPQWEAIVEWLDSSPDAAGLREAVAGWEVEHANDWERGGGSSHTPGYPSGCWNQSFYRISDGQFKSVVLAPGCPHQSIWTDAEIEQFSAKPLASAA